MLDKQHTDAEIISSLQRGEAWALTAIFNVYWKPLYATAYRKTGSHDQAEEIVQELFADLWRKRESLFQKDKDASGLYAYLLMAVKNKILNQVRSSLHKQEYFEYYKNACSAVEKITDHDLDYNELVDTLEKGMNCLPQKTKEVFRLHRFEGKSSSYIARHLNLSEKAIEYHLSKSVKFLRIYLKDFVALLLLCNI